MRSGRQNVQLARPMDGQTKAISHNIRNGLGKVISGANIRERQPGSGHLGARRLTGATRIATPTKILLRRAVIGIEHLAVTYTPQCVPVPPLLARCTLGAAPPPSVAADAHPQVVSNGADVGDAPQDADATVQT